jgi:hypothetical protein
MIRTSVGRRSPWVDTFRVKQVARNRPTRSLPVNGVEVTTEDDARLRDKVDQAFDDARAMADRRAIIEQAKGMLMFLYGIDSDAAFEILQRQSQQHNVKLRRIAEQIVNDLVDLTKAGDVHQRLAANRLLLTAHRRVSRAVERQADGQSKTDA